MTENDLVPVGKCPEHGIVAGEEVRFNFPNAPECTCGRELVTDEEYRCTVVPEEQYAKYLEQA